MARRHVTQLVSTGHGPIDSKWGQFALSPRGGLCDERLPVRESVDQPVEDGAQCVLPGCIVPDPRQRFRPGLLRRERLRVARRAGTPAVSRSMSRRRARGRGAPCRDGRRLRVHRERPDVLTARHGGGVPSHSRCHRCDRPRSPGVCPPRCPRLSHQWLFLCLSQW